MYDAASDPTEKLHDLQELAALLGLFAVELQQISWPTPSRGAVAGLATAARTAQTAAERLISKPNEQTAAAFTAAVGTLSASSSRMRLTLGLPSLG